MSSLPRDVDRAAAVESSAPDHPDESLERLELSTPKPLASIEDALLDEIDVHSRYPWA